VARRVFAELSSFYGSAFLVAHNFDTPRSKNIIIQRSGACVYMNRKFGFNTYKHVLLNVYLDHLLSGRIRTSAFSL
jgi:hypothetical protein